jgi:hypothetical protein
MIYKHSQKKYPLCAKKKNISQRRRGAKIKTPLRLSYFAPLREKKSAAADPKCCGTGSKENTPLREEKKECLAKKGRRQGRKKSLCGFASLRLCVNLLFIKKSIGDTVEIA